MPGRSPRFTTGGTVYADDITLANLAAGAAAGSSSWVSAQDWSTLRLSVRGVAFTGGTSPTLTVTVEHAPDTSGSGVVALGAFPARTAGQTSRLVIGPVDRFVRVSWASTGTPTTVSFTVDGEAV